MGYAGGTLKDPTYHNIGDHTEVVQIDFDPETMSYETLLSAFWQSHNPSRPPYSRQYMSLILYHCSEQEGVAQRSLQAETSCLGSITTALQPLHRFYLAESYHQKYYLRRVRELETELLHRFPTMAQFLEASIVTKLNGYLGGYGTTQRLSREIDSFALSDKARQRLVEIVQSYGK